MDGRLPGESGDWILVGEDTWHTETASIDGEKKVERTLNILRTRRTLRSGENDSIGDHLLTGLISNHFSAIHRVSQ